RGAGPLATLANVLGSAAGLLRARGQLGAHAPSLHQLLAYARRPAAHGSASSAGRAAGPGTLAAAADTSAAGARSTGVAQAGTSAVAHASAPTSGHPHHGVFSSPVDGTHALSLVLLIDVALLGALVLWRLAQRWVVPRFI
ncbi:MAG: hypothetical protein QOC55_1096, partial [Thermoleophilaceae bacterium]|nr:hypothetical protein [Thermoleophilaceae bacterium]